MPGGFDSYLFRHVLAHQHPLTPDRQRTMLNFFLYLLLLIVLLPMSLMFWQQVRYRRIRRRSAQDRQDPLHSQNAFHLCIHFEVNNGRKVLDSAREFCHHMLNGGDATLIYAGQVVFTQQSEQLLTRDWDGILVFEFPSRERFNAAYTHRLRRARRVFRDSYVYGFGRHRRISASFPQYLLRLAARSFWRGEWRLQALRKPDALAALPQYDELRQQIQRLEAAQAINPKGLVVYSLLSRQRALQPMRDTASNTDLFTRMGRLGHGPIHLGSFLRLEHNAVFDSVFVVQYPSPNYFAELISSQFHHTITHGSGVGDALLLATVPITDRL